MGEFTLIFWLSVFITRIPQEGIWHADKEEVQGALGK
jgi:hypothetical protein